MGRCDLCLAVTEVDDVALVAHVRDHAGARCDGTQSRPGARKDVHEDAALWPLGWSEQFEVPVEAHRVADLER